MILSDREIRDYLKCKIIEIDPLDDPWVQIQPCSVDLRLGNDFKVFRKSLEYNLRVVDPYKKNVSELMDTVLVGDGASFILPPNHFALACTIERVCIPSHILGRVDGRSSIGRLGILIHATAGLIDPGFDGYLTLELANLSPYPVVLYPGMRICQISFEMLSWKCENPYGSRKENKYQHQTGATMSKLYKDLDRKVIDTE
jgi:dCTP deaminase